MTILIRRIFVRILVFLISLAVCGGAFEIATRIFIVKDRIGIPPRQAFLRDGNTANTLLMSVYDDDCSWVERFRPSLRFGYVLRSKGRCALKTVDENGFHNRTSFPDQRDPSAFSILIIGGSVAEALAASDEAESFLGRAFRAKYAGPKGERIEVYSGALGGWEVPTQELVLMTYMQGFDAVIALDGANELSHLDYQNWLGQPNPLNFAFRFDHTATFGVEFSLVKTMRAIRRTWPFDQSYAWSGLLSLLEIESQDELFSNVYAEGRIGQTAQLPFRPNLNRQEVVARNIERYVRSAKNIHAMSRANGLLSAHFIQPIAGVAKALTDEEKEFENYPNIEFYRQLEGKTLAALKAQPTFSLVDIFAREKSTVYADRVHPKVVGPGRNSFGYEMLANAIVERTAQLWRLKKSTSDNQPND